jgi:hypothetical protein
MRLQRRICRQRALWGHASEPVGRPSGVTWGAPCRAGPWEHQAPRLGWVRQRCAALRQSATTSDAAFRAQAAPPRRAHPIGRRHRSSGNLRTKTAGATHEALHPQQVGSRTNV